MTLVEMLVAMTATLILMGLIGQMLAMFGQGVSSSRSMTELNERLRSVAYRLRQDLVGVTVDLSPPVRPESNTGYFEIIEGPNSENIAVAADGSGVIRGFAKWLPVDINLYEQVTGSDDHIVGDTDDALLFTTKSMDVPYTGKIGTNMIGSPLAEVAWFCTPTPNAVNPRMYTLHRRQRLIMAHPGVPPFTGAVPNTMPFTTFPDLYAVTDVACRIQSGLAIPNTPGDLTKRENRFLHNPTVFPHVFESGSPLITFGPDSPRFGEDVILTNVISFDVRVYDPGAPIQVPVSGIAVTPGDPGFVPGGGVPVTGAYVDLGYGLNGTPPHNGPYTSNVRVPVFYGYGGAQSGLAGSALSQRTYCTWSTHYEYNGLDDDSDGVIDQGTDGVDNNGDGLVDEAAESETAPPYTAPLTGIEIRIRCYEPSSRQIRQITVRHAFNQE